MSRFDDYDYEVKYAKDEKLTAGFMVNFKSMSVLLERFEEETKEYDDKYPKNELLKIWGSIMFCYVVLFALSYKILFIVTLPFIFFYTYSLYHVFKAWKRFKYKTGPLWGMTIVGIIAAIALGMGLQTIIMHFLG